MPALGPSIKPPTPLWNTSITKTPTMIATSTFVTETRFAFAMAIRRPGPAANSLRASPTQVGHWWPTGAGTMHSVQIGRPQRVQCTPVTRSGWR